VPKRRPGRASTALVPYTSDDRERIIPRRPPMKENGVGTSSIMIMPKRNAQILLKRGLQWAWAHISLGRPRTVLIPGYVCQLSYPSEIAHAVPQQHHGRHDLVFLTSLAISAHAHSSASRWPRFVIIIWTTVAINSGENRMKPQAYSASIVQVHHGYSDGWILFISTEFEVNI
jgi:hypothetical protein